MKKTGKSKKNLYFIQMILAVILILLLVLLCVWYGDGFSSYHPKGETIQYIAGTRAEYSAEATYSVEDGVMKVVDGENVLTLQSTPILYQGEMKITIPCNMMYSNPAYAGNAYRINYFTTLTYKNDLIFMENENKKAEVFGGYLYDGNNTYIFLENVTLHIGSQAIVLGPLSYARVNYLQSIEYYNSLDSSYEWIATGNLSITADYDETYSLDLGRDVIITSTGENLIYSAVDTLDVIPMK